MAKPLLFVTGFFGAGKTTLLRSLLGELRERGKLADVILNDFSNADFEAASLGERASMVAPLAAGCACCESLGEMVDLCRVATRGNGDLLLVELNGAADPLTLFEAFALLDEELPFFPRLQVTVVDARHWGKRGNWNLLESRQLETAGFWMLTHRDVVEENRLAKVRESCREMVVPTSVSISLPELVEVLLAALEGTDPGVPGIDAARKEVSPESDAIHALAHQFSSLEIPLPARVKRHAVEQMLRDLPSTVVRAKVLVKLVERPGSRWLFQRSGQEPLPEPFPVPNSETFSSSLVCVGVGMKLDQVQQPVRDAFGDAVDILWLRRSQDPASIALASDSLLQEAPEKGGL